MQKGATHQNPKKHIPLYHCIIKMVVVHYIIQPPFLVRLAGRKTKDESFNNNGSIMWDAILFWLYTVLPNCMIFCKKLRKA